MDERTISDQNQQTSSVLFFWFIYHSLLSCVFGLFSSPLLQIIEFDDYLEVTSSGLTHTCELYGAWICPEVHELLHFGDRGNEGGGSGAGTCYEEGEVSSLY